VSTAVPVSSISRPALWFGLLGGALAWLVHLLGAYAAAEFGCVGGLGERQQWGVSLVAWLVIAVTAAALVPAMAATLIAYRCYRRLPEGAADAEPSAERLAARAGMLTSGLFALVIVFESIPVLYYLRAC
jgi:phage shock protein PspC (stress-responsive transcriptional regulator)